MPIRPDARFLYPIDWPQISAWVRFSPDFPGRRFSPGRCQRCGRPHEARVFQLSDGRWLDIENATWRTDRGRACRPPDAQALASGRFALSRVAACHRDHNPSNSRPRNLAAWCGRCHLDHDRPEHLRRRRLTIRSRFAVGDLFEGRYR